MEMILFNAPVKSRTRHSRLTPPLGLGYIAASIMRAVYQVSALDFNVSGLNLRRIENIIQWGKPALVGISAHTETYGAARDIARKVKEIDGRIKIVLGGPHPSIMPEQVLGEMDVDYVIAGEGEETVVELLRCTLEGRSNPSEILGLGYRDCNGVVRVNGRRALLDPDEIPWPARELFPLDLYEEQWNVLTARGSCPFKCPFCSASQIWGGRRKARSPQNIIEELKALVAIHGAEHVTFIDDIFTADKKWAYGLIDLLAGLSPQLTWTCATRVDCVDDDLVSAMAGSGCRAIQYGIESGSQTILDSVKGIRKDQVLKAVKSTIAAGIKVTCSFMIPFPDDTVETIRETKVFIRQVLDEGSDMVMSYTTPHPGTAFYERADEFGLKILSTRWADFDAKHNILETRHLSRFQIEELAEEMVRELGLARRDFESLR
jgi:anaerobic magnesium-protoporphyrin IX monomethyl ester cyclase